MNLRGWTHFDVGTEGLVIGERTEEVDPLENQGSRQIRTGDDLLLNEVGVIADVASLRRDRHSLLVVRARGSVSP